MALESPCGIRLEHVGYAYEDEQDVLRDLSFDFKPGTCTAVLGETGAGKTTLIRVILGLVVPKAGKAEIYSSRASHVHLSQLTRCNLAYVPQGNTLLSGTVRDNLRLGKLSATDDEMKEALRLSCAGFLLDSPDGLDTVCGEQGGGLSEGQAQRIAIARALLRDCPVLLLDEATSALDPDTERQLLGNILSDKKRTVIFITHRLAVKDFCDQTLTIEKA